MKPLAGQPTHQLTPQPWPEVPPPLPLAPLFFSKVWGGERLAAVAEKGAPAGASIGESWEVADLPEGETRVAAGPLAGQGLGALTRRYGAALAGTRAPPGRFPLLIKLIDAREDLSVQVHPGPDTAPQLAGAHSKDEAWLILHSETGGRVLHGLREPTAPMRFRQALERGEVEALLQPVPVAAGDVVHVPPGTVHAIGAGVLLLEVQEPSDTTFRVWDYGRLGLDGQPRPLHVAEALQVAALGPARQPPGRPVYHPLPDGNRWANAVDAPGYRLELLELVAGAQLSATLTGETCVVAICLDGTLALAQPPGTPAGAEQSLTLSPLQTLLVPACAGTVRLSTPSGARVALAGLGGAPLLPGIRP